MHTIEGNGFWVLPGGRCNFGEDTSSALKREMMEEMKTEVTVGPLAWVVENFFTHNGRKHQNTGFYYHAAFEKGHPYYRKEDTISFLENGRKLLFRWYDIAALRRLPVYPSFLADRAGDEYSGITHIIHEDLVPENVFAEGLESSEDITVRYHKRLPLRIEKEFAADGPGRDVFVEGRPYSPSGLEALSAVSGNRIAGVLTFLKEGGAYRIITLERKFPGRGIRSMLVDSLKKRAFNGGVSEILADVTNDDIESLCFYQKNGFGIDSVCSGSVSSARLMDPDIPLSGANGIEIRDEIRLKLKTGEGRTLPRD